MNIKLHKRFIKAFAKLSPAEQKQFFLRRDLFLQNPFDRRLRNHGLSGEFEGCRSIDITGDLRVIYAPIAGQGIIFLKIGTHSQLYD